MDMENLYIGSKKLTAEQTRMVIDSAKKSLEAWEGYTPLSQEIASDSTLLDPKISSKEYRRIHKLLRLSQGLNINTDQTEELKTLVRRHALRITYEGLQKIANKEHRPVEELLTEQEAVMSSHFQELKHLVN